MDSYQQTMYHWVMLILFVYSASSENITKGFLETTMMKIQRERLKESPDDPTFASESASLVKPVHEMLNGDHPEMDNYVTVPTEKPHYAETEQLLKLTKQQLLALYHIAIKKGESLNLQFNPLRDVPSNSHELGENGISSIEHEIPPVEHGTLPGNNGNAPGYYYYYYPIKSFIKDENNTAQLMDDLMAIGMKENMIEGNEGGDGSMRPVEPLFLAMASFIGVAMMFMASILFLPKFGTHKTREILFRQGSDELLTFTKLVTESIEGKDCSKRIACEVGQTIRNLNLSTKTIRIIELLLPNKLARQLTTVRRSAERKEKCRFINCRNVHQTTLPPKNT